MFDSVRSRLTLWYSIVLVAVLLLLAVSINAIAWRTISRRADGNLVELADAFGTTFEAELPDHTGPDAPKESARVAIVEHRFRDTIFVVTDASGQTLVTSLELPASAWPGEKNEDLLSSRALRELQPTSQGVFADIPGGRDGFRGYARILPAGAARYRLVVLQSLHPRREMMDDIRDTFLWIIPLALLLASAGGYFLARKSLSPVAAMAEKAGTMGAANLRERLDVANPRDELGRLALSFNQLLDRLEDSFERQRRFVADASHELRTPVSILRGEAEVTLSRPDRSPEEYREALATLRDESQHLTRIIEDLFTLTRADAGQYPLNLRDIYLDELAIDALHRARSLALAKHITLTSAIAPELLLHADEVLLGRMILNLLDNAIKYTPEGGTVSLECVKQGDEYRLSISDTGPGISPELQDRIFERFFRADKARSRADGGTGGAGLGLSIARWIAEAHHGRLELTRSGPGGTAFTAWLPARTA